MHKGLKEFRFNLQFHAEKTLQELLDGDLYKQVTDKLGDSKIATVSDGNWIPKEKFDNLNEEKKQYKEQLDVLKENKVYLFKDGDPDGTGGSIGVGAGGCVIVFW